MASQSLTCTPYLSESDGKLKAAGIVIGIRNTTDRTIKVMDGPGRATAMVNGKAHVLPIEQEAKRYLSKEPWEIPAKDVLPVPEKDRRSFNDNGEFELPLAAELKVAKKMTLTFIFNPLNNDADKIWNGQLACGPVEVVLE